MIYQNAVVKRKDTHFAKAGDMKNDFFVPETSLLVEKQQKGKNDSFWFCYLFVFHLSR
jgi:hypothetical protein